MQHCILTPPEYDEDCTRWKRRWIISPEQTRHPDFPLRRSLPIIGNILKSSSRCHILIVSKHNMQIGISNLMRILAPTDALRKPRTLYGKHSDA